MPQQLWSSSCACGPSGPHRRCLTRTCAATNRIHAAAVRERPLAQQAGSQAKSLRSPSTLARPWSRCQSNTAALYGAQYTDGVGHGRWYA